MLLDYADAAISVYVIGWASITIWDGYGKTFRAEPDNWLWPCIVSSWCWLCQYGSHGRGGWVRLWLLLVLMDFEGQPPVVRVWRPMLSGAPVCVIPCAMLAGKLMPLLCHIGDSGIDDICSDSDTRRVCILGKEAQRKQQMISIWSIPLPSTTGKAPVCKPAELIAKQVGFCSSGRCSSIVVCWEVWALPRKK